MLLLKLLMMANDKLSIYETERVLFPFILRFYYTEKKLIRIAFLHGKKNDQKFPQNCLQNHFPEWLINAMHQIQAYLLGQQKIFQIPYSWSAIANPLYLRSMQYLAEIPYGSVISYESFARMANLSSARHAGKVLSENPLPMIIPCHRVIRKDGSTGGFTPDLSIKRYLLALESSVCHV